MKGAYTIEKCGKDQIKTIVDGINDYNLRGVPEMADTWTALEYAATDQNGNTIGGILGGIGYWNGLEIKILWVAESHRKLGIGSALLDQMERVAKEKGAVISMLDTFDFQAPDFYLSKGYSIIGRIDDFPPGHCRMYFSKKLT
ncbi:MAG: GNAT family N-acetyltransferase [Bacteroidota bacterium]